MPRTRLGTTVDQDLLATARAAEMDAAYTSAYTTHPIDEPEEWGDVASFREAAARTGEQVRDR
jgi:hypothetical protein